jgi:hypothetical protein
MRKSQRKNTRKQQGGAWGFGPPVAAGHINNFASTNLRLGGTLTPDCLAAVKPDTMGFFGAKGLPGLSGGSRKQRGGRYGFVSADGAAAPGSPWLGGLAPMQSIACEARTPNPMNKQLGGAAHLMGAPLMSQATAGGPVSTAGPDQAYYAPTAGYGNQASSWVGSTGAPSLIQNPYAAHAMNPACLKTGGARRTKSRKGKKRVNRR